jgi:hypothetical protein
MVWHRLPFVILVAPYMGVYKTTLLNGNPCYVITRIRVNFELLPRYR